MLHYSDAYAIYWDPEGLYEPEWERSVDEYFQNVGSASAPNSGEATGTSLETVFALDAQYTDSNRSGREQIDVLRRLRRSRSVSGHGRLHCAGGSGVHHRRTDPHRAGARDQDRTGFLAASGIPVYYILTPPGVTVCTKASGGECSEPAGTDLHRTGRTVKRKNKRKAHEGFCGYHSYMTEAGDPEPIIYAVQPWVAGDAGEAHPLLQSR